MFNTYNSKRVTRKAHQLTAGDTIVYNSNYPNKAKLVLDGVKYYFAYHQEPKVGDYIVYLNDEDIYHCSEEVFNERNQLNILNRVPSAHIDKLLETVTYQFERVGDSTVTICCAFLPNGFQVGTGESACIDPDNYDQHLGEQFAQERAYAEAKETLWQLEGYLLKVTGQLSCDN